MNYTEREINSQMFSRIVDSGSARLKMKVDEVNGLNVFPIPDGDTGENMYLTFKGGVDAMHAEKSDDLYLKAYALSQGMLLGARGNSGVILSQLFFGLAEGLRGMTTAKLCDFVKALGKGVEKAYSAVVNPVEGTILTVAREAVEKTCDNIDENTSWVDFFEQFLSKMKLSLKHTPDLLQTLKEAGVIDSGGAGLVYIVEGFYKAFIGEDYEGEIAVTADTKSEGLDYSKFTEDSVMEFGYCTEVLLRLQNSKTDVDAFCVDELIKYLNTLGDSIVAFKTGTIVKMHVHTMKPYKVLEYCQQFGEYLSVKIENMTLQHNETAEEDKGLSQEFKVERARRRFAIVTVASGDGLIEMFKDLGADAVISGGQTNNPSSEDFLTAFKDVNADYVFVLPNNGNVVLTAKQAAEIYKNSDVRVIESKNIGQGYSVLSMLDYSSDDPDVIEEQFNSDLEGVTTGMVSVAVRDTTVNGVTIKKGDYIGFTDHTMLVSNADKMTAEKELADKLDLDEKSFFIAVFGCGATDEEKAELESYINEKYPEIEFYSVDGGQEVYDLIVIVE